MDIHNILAQQKKKPLSNFNIEKLLNKKCNIILYPDLYKYSSLDQILKPFDACVLLYQTTEDFGHWCCVIKINNNLVEFFDPYGTFVDDELKFIDMNFREESHQLYPHLTWLLYNSPYQLSYNEHKFQKMSEDIQTCGRWTAFRILCKNMNLKEFFNLINKLCKNLKISKDELVTLITMWSY
jgi:hypothetical protein